MCSHGSGINEKIPILPRIDHRPCAIDGCKHYTEKTNICAYHLHKYHGLAIKKSTIPNAGFGLFATHLYKKDEVIAYYTGKVLTDKQAKKSNSQYILKIESLPNFNIDSQNKYEPGAARW